MTLIANLSRWVLGTTLLLFGLNGFMHFYALRPTTAKASAFLEALWNSGYLMYVEKAIEIFVGLCLILNKYQAAAVLIFFPLALNILIVDLYLQPQYWYMGGTVFVMEVVLLVFNRPAYRPLIEAERLR